MRRHFLNLFWIALSLSLTGMLTSCNDDDKIPLDDDGNEIEYDISELPTEDQLETVTKISLFVPSNSGLSDVAQAIVRRCPSASGYADAGAILLTSNFIATADEEKLGKIKDYYNAGGIILMDRPTPNSFKTLEVGMGLDKITDPMEEHDDHDAYDIFGFNMHFDIYKLNDVFDEDGSKYHVCRIGEVIDENGNSTPEEVHKDYVSEGKEEQSLTPYMAGKLADPVAGWLTENSIPDEWRNARKKQALTKGSGELEDILHAQSITHTSTLNVDEWWKDKCSDNVWKNLKDKQIVYTTTTRIYVAYSYAEDADYYLVEQTVWGNNSHQWMGSWSTGKYDHQGLYLGRIELWNYLMGSTYHYDPNRITMDDGLILEEYSPQTINGATTCSTSVGFNIGGNVGLSKTGPSANVSYGVSKSVSKTFTIQDLSVVALCGDDENTRNDTHWTYTTRWYNYDYDWKGKPIFKSPAQLSTNSIETSQCWRWKLTNPKRFTSITLSYSYYLIMCADYRKWVDIVHKTYAGTDFLHKYFEFNDKIVLPNRDPNL